MVGGGWFGENSKGCCKCDDWKALSRLCKRIRVSKHENTSSEKTSFSLLKVSWRMKRSKTFFLLIVSKTKILEILKNLKWILQELKDIPVLQFQTCKDYWTKMTSWRKVWLEELDVNLVLYQRTLSQFYFCFLIAVKITSIIIIII